MAVYTNYSSDLDFFWKYQMNHMMTRYLLWNYAGREGWTQDDGANIAPFNKIGNFFGNIINVNFNGDIKRFVVWNSISARFDMEFISTLSGTGKWHLCLWLCLY